MENKKRLKSLRTPNDFVSLRKNGRTFHPSPWLMVSFEKKTGHEVRCAWTISRKAAPSVIRNRLKRWGREFLRPWANEFDQGVDFNLIFKQRDKDFYRKLDHKEFDSVLKKVVGRFGNA